MDIAAIERTYKSVCAGHDTPEAILVSRSIFRWHLRQLGWDKNRIRRAMYQLDKSQPVPTKLLGSPK